jgi:hypothetical protein
MVTSAPPLNPEDKKFLEFPYPGEIDRPTMSAKRNAVAPNIFVMCPVPK